MDYEAGNKGSFITQAVKHHSYSQWRKDFGELK